MRNWIPIGRLGHTVSIDETLIAKRKPGTGNAQGCPVAEQWVFGGIDLATR